MTSLSVMSASEPVVGDYDHYIHRPVSANDLHGVGAFLLMCEECEQVF